MCILTATACHHTSQSQYNTVSTKARFAPLCVSTGTSQVVHNITPVTQNCSGVISEVKKNYGYIDFTLDHAAWEKTLTKNGASVLPKNEGNLFFFENQVGCAMRELSVGDKVNFDVKHVKTTNKLIAFGVTVEQKVGDIRMAKAIANQLASVNCMMPVVNSVSGFVRSFTTVGAGKTAKISELCSSHGYLDYPTGTTTKLPFHMNALYSCAFHELQVNDTVKFNLVRNNNTGKLLAQGVQFMHNEAPKMTYCGHFIDMVEPTPVASSTPNKMIKLATAVIGKIQKIGTDFIICENEGNRVFIHDSQLYGNSITELKLCDDVQFDVYYNQANGKYVGKSAQRNKRAMNIGSFLSMETATFTTSSNSEYSVLAKEVTGEIKKIGKDYGLIEFNKCAKGYVYFHESSLVGTVLSELVVGCCLSFSVLMNNKTGNNIAKDVQIHIETKRPSIPKYFTPSIRVWNDKKIMNVIEGELPCGKPDSSQLKSPHRSLVTSRRNSAYAVLPPTARK